MAKMGTVRELSSVFLAEEAQKASMRVQETISERRRELDKLRSFTDDNTILINLVRKLPDETHHDIMVLLGEGYHAERSAKQTVEILKRRGEALETQIESLNAVMEDLKLEASFFDNTGYKVDNGEAVVEDEEYAHILARMAELEKEEEEAEEFNGSYEDEKLQNEQDNALRRDSTVRTDHEVRSIPPATQEAPIVSKEGASHGDHPARYNVMSNKDSELPQDEKKNKSSS